MAARRQPTSVRLFVARDGGERGPGLLLGSGSPSLSPAGAVGNPVRSSGIQPLRASLRGQKRPGRGGAAAEQGVAALCRGICALPPPLGGGAPSERGRAAPGRRGEPPGSGQGVPERSPGGTAAPGEGGMKEGRQGKREGGGGRPPRPARVAAPRPPPPRRPSSLRPPSAGVGSAAGARRSQRERSGAAACAARRPFVPAAPTSGSASEGRADRSGAADPRHAVRGAGPGLPAGAAARPARPLSTKGGGETGARPRLQPQRWPRRPRAAPRPPRRAPATAGPPGGMEPPLPAAGHRES